MKGRSGCSTDLLQSIHREVPWLTTGSSAGDWRYASLLDAHQLSADRLWVLGRSLDPAYTAASRASAESPLAGRQAAWDLQLDLLSLPGGDVVASLTLPYWVGGFTSDGLLYFFDEVEGDRGRIVVTRLRLESDSNFSP